MKVGNRWRHRQRQKLSVQFFSSKRSTRLARYLKWKVAADNLMAGNSKWKRCKWLRKLVTEGAKVSTHVFLVKLHLLNACQDTLDKLSNLAPKHVKAKSCAWLSLSLVKVAFDNFFLQSSSSSGRRRRNRKLWQRISALLAEWRKCRNEEEA